MTGSTATVFELNTGTTEPEEWPSLPIRIDGHDYRLRKPKLALAASLVSLMEGGRISEDASVQDVGVRLVQLLWSLVAYVEDEPPEPLVIEGPDGEAIPNPKGGELRGRAHLFHRLNDPRDRLDLLQLAPLFERVVEAMFNRPTGPSHGSSTTPGDGGSDSVAASPEPPAETSGT